MSVIDVYPDSQSVIRAAANRFVSAAEAAITTRGRFIVALSGGNTPRALYKLLSSDEFLALVEWTKVYVFWGDERVVPPDHRASNYHMAREALLDYAPMPMSNIYRIPGELDPVQAADLYEFKMRDFFEGRSESAESRARFDLVLLGMGEDGHTASLFPHTPALEVHDRWVVSQYVEKLKAWRVTLTPEALNGAANILFIVTGEKKAPALQRVLQGEPEPHEYPAQLIQPRDGNLMWLVDSAAASLLANTSNP